jgi:hypothetical protein
MNNFPARLLLDIETLRTLQAHCIAFNDFAITVDDFNHAIEAVKIGLEASGEICMQREARRLEDMQIWTTAQLRHLGIVPSVNPTTPYL